MFVCPVLLYAAASPFAYSAPFLDVLNSCVKAGWQPMTPERWQRLKELCNLALEREPSERNAFLAEACLGDEELLREADSIVARATSGGGILCGPIWKKFGVDAPGVLDREPIQWVPAAIGHFRILRVLGEGGMGIVYEAEQDHPRRHVALKTIKLALANAQMLRRFDRESQALARLHHPGIAQVYEAGTAETEFGPVPYFAMEFIHGTPLCQYTESRRLGTRERLEMMARVCEAVEHAHQNGIIHRDLKPGNILVDETGQPKILDFGVARVTDSDIQLTRQTDVGQLIGTLAYMSPEQVTADTQELDARSDVYALGVILYELLAQRRPYEISDQLLDAVRTIREEDPKPLSSINRTFRGDVETIVAKALEKDKARRYTSAAAMQADIRKYLADEPITARPASAVYHLRKFALRHKALVSATAIVFVVLITGVIISTREAVKARRAEQTAEAVNDFLQHDLLAQASTVTQTDPSTKPDPDLKVRTALDRAAAKVGGKFDRQPEVEAAIRDTIGQTYLDLGLYSDARTQFERALELQRRVLGPENPTTLKTLSGLSWLDVRTERYADAERLAKRALDAQRRVLPHDHPDVATSMTNLATALYYEVKYAEAEALYVQALEINRKSLGPEHPSTLADMNDLAEVYFGEGKYAESEALYTRILEIRRRVLGPEHPYTLATMSGLSQDYVFERKEAEAEALMLQTLELERRVLGPEHDRTLDTAADLAYLYGSEGKFAQAEALYSQILETAKRVFGPENSRTLDSQVNLAVQYYYQGKFAQAEALEKQTLETSRRVSGADGFYTIYSQHCLANTYAAQGKYAKAETLDNQALEGWRRVYGPEHPNTLSVYTEIAFTYQREGKYAAAESYTAQALTGRRRAFGSEQRDTMWSAADLAFVYILQRKFADGEPLAREAVDFDRKKEADNWERFRAESILGASLAGQKKYEDAEPLLVQGYTGMLARKDRIDVPEWYYLDRAHEWLVQMYLAWGKPDQASYWRKQQFRNCVRRGVLWQCHSLDIELLFQK
jgi:eukaryotic-like serine/threonine-protein kinase